MTKVQIEKVQNVENLSVEDFQNRSTYGYVSNKDIDVQKIDAIEIEKFRRLKTRVLS